MAAKNPAAGERPAVLVLDLVSLSPKTSAQVVRRISDIFVTELANAGKYRLVSQDSVKKLEQTGLSDMESQRELTRAQAHLKAGIASYENLEFEKALVQIQQARALLVELGGHVEALKLLPRVLLYQGVAQLSGGKAADSTASFEELLRLRPGHQIDAVLFPPEVVKAFNQVKQRVTALPRGTVSFTSSPPFANVMMDGLPRGDTPLIVKGIVPGKHRFVISKPGHLNWQKQIEVGPGAALQKQVSLRKNPVLLYLKETTEAVRRGANRETTSAAAVKLTRSLGVDYLLAAALSRSDKNYLVAATLINAKTGSTKKITFGLIDSDLLNSATELKKMANALGDLTRFMEPAPDDPEHRKILAAWGQPVDFGKHLLGMEPGPAEPVATEPKPITKTVNDLAAKQVAHKARQPVEPPPDPEPRSEGRWYSKWWVWTTVAAVVGGGVATTLILLNQDSAGPRPDSLHIETTLNPPAGP